MAYLDLQKLIEALQKLYLSILSLYKALHRSRRLLTIGNHKAVESYHYLKPSGGLPGSEEAKN